MSALRHTRGTLAGQGPRPAAISVQGVQEDIQCRDRHPFGGSSPQRQVACLWNLPCRWVDGSPIGRTLRVCRHYCISLAAPVSHRRKPAAPQAHGHCRGRRNLCPEKPQGANGNWDAKRDAGAARPAKGGFQMSRFRCWLPLTGVARQSVPFSLRSMLTACGRSSNRSWTRISFW